MKNYITSILLLLSTGSYAQYNFYRGNLHAHSDYSDGNKDAAQTGVRTPKGCYEFAKKSKDFNFLGISEHNHSQAGMKDKNNFKKGIADAKSANEDNKFVCLYGMEYGVIKNGGHVLIYGLDKLVGWEDGNHDIFCGKFDYKELWRIIDGKSGAFATLAHPEKEDYDNLMGDHYNKDAAAAICGVAVATGPAFATSTNYDEHPAKRFHEYYKGMLAKGYRVGPTIDHDNHNLTFGRMAESRTVVLAKKLTKSNILDALRARRFYASDDRNAEIYYTINDNHYMGSSVKASEALLNLEVKDKDKEGVKSIKIYYGTPGSNLMPEVIINEKNTDNIYYSILIGRGESLYFYAEIIQEDGDRIYTAPIWVSNN